MANYIQYSNIVGARSNNSEEEPSLGIISVPASDIILTGAATDPNRTEGTGLLTFGIVSDQQVVGTIQLPTSYKEGTNVWPRAIWNKVAELSGDVAWVFRYRWTNIGDLNTDPYINIGIGDELVDAQDTIGLQADNYWKTPFIGNGKKIGSVIQYQFFRDVSEDTHASGVSLTCLYFVYQVDTTGADLVQYPFQFLGK